MHLIMSKHKHKNKIITFINLHLLFGRKTFPSGLFGLVSNWQPVLKGLSDINARNRIM